MLARIINKIYQPQLKFRIPLDVLEEKVRSQPPLPDGYTVRSPMPNEDLEAWAALLNEDGEFGLWTAERVRSEIISRLIRPDAASLLFFDGKLVGCCNSAEAPGGNKRIGVGMYLYISRSHRGKRSLAYVLIFRMLEYFLLEKFDVVAHTTDPGRDSAIVLYLRNGFKPWHDSLFSFCQWWVVRKRLGPLVEKLIDRDRKQGREIA